ncbi:hypothetical protein U1Q18_049070, partial [Sarracenia purpurea var. burkii]
CSHLACFRFPCRSVMVFLLNLAPAAIAYFACSHLPGSAAGFEGHALRGLVPADIVFVPANITGIVAVDSAQPCASMVLAPMYIVLAAMCLYRLSRVLVDSAARSSCCASVFDGFLGFGARVGLLCCIWAMSFQHVALVPMVIYILGWFRRSFYCILARSLSIIGQVFFQ